jgi:hypothetical protein
MFWKFNQVISEQIDLASKHRITASILDGNNDRWIMLKFQSKPTDAMIQAEALKACYSLNNPQPKEPTVEELKRVIVEKDALIAENDKEIAELKAEKVK